MSVGSAASTLIAMMNRNEARALEAVAIVCGIVAVCIMVALFAWAGA